MLQLLLRATESPLLKIFPTHVQREVSRSRRIKCLRCMKLKHLKRTKIPHCMFQIIFSKINYYLHRKFLTSTLIFTSNSIRDYLCVLVCAQLCLGNPLNFNRNSDKAHTRDFMN
jgi:hypothetical protein